MKRFLLLMLLLSTSCSNIKEKLFNTLYHQTFIPKEDVTIEFIDSTHFMRYWHGDSAKERWSIESRLTGTYLILDHTGERPELRKTELKVESVSDTVIIFSAGEFNPRFELKR